MSRTSYLTGPAKHSFSEWDCWSPENSWKASTAVVHTAPSQWHGETAIQAHKWHFVIKFISRTLFYCSLHKRLPSQQVFDIHHVPQYPQLLERQSSPHQALVSLCAQAPNETTAAHELVSLGKDWVLHCLGLAMTLLVLSNWCDQTHLPPVSRERTPASILRGHIEARVCCRGWQGIIATQWEVLSLLPWEPGTWEEGHVGQACQQRNQLLMGSLWGWCVLWGMEDCGVM